MDGVDIPVELNVAKPVPYEQRLAEQHAAQAGMSRQEVKDQMASTSEATDDLEALVEKGHQRQHNWHDHGLKRVCYDAGHPMHEVWLKH